MLGGWNRRISIPHAAPVPPMTIKIKTIRNIDASPTPPTDHRGFLVVGDWVPLLFCAVGAGRARVVGGVAGAGSSRLSAGCLAGSTTSGAVFGGKYAISGDLGAIYPISPTLEGSGPASGRDSTVAVRVGMNNGGEASHGDIRESVVVEEEAEDIIRAIFVTRNEGVVCYFSIFKTRVTSWLKACAGGNRSKASDEEI